MKHQAKDWFKFVGINIGLGVFGKENFKVNEPSEKKHSLDNYTKPFHNLTPGTTNNFNKTSKLQRH